MRNLVKSAVAFLALALAEPGEFPSQGVAANVVNVATAASPECAVHDRAGLLREAERRMWSMVRESASNAEAVERAIAREGIILGGVNGNITLASPGEAVTSATDSESATAAPTATSGRQTPGFRNYTEEEKNKNSRVVNHYSLMRKYQTVEYVQRMLREWTKLDKAVLTFREIFEILKDYVDSSDPDFGLPNTLHNFQTAEAIREQGLPDWMQLVGVLHDVGKLQFAWGNDADGQSGKGDGQQYALGGDIWVVGARIPDSVILSELNTLNADMMDPRYNTTLGIYKQGIGMSNVMFCWGHDEYMYRVLEHQSTIPKEGLAMIRFHSAYPWHQQGEYSWFETEEDIKMIPWIKLFNRFDLYEKKKTPPPDLEALMPYYEALFLKYIPGGKLRF